MNCRIEFDHPNDVHEWYVHLSDDVVRLVSRGDVLESATDIRADYRVEATSRGGVRISLVSPSLLTSPTKFECRNQQAPIISAAAHYTLVGEYTTFPPLRTTRSLVSTPRFCRCALHARW